MTDSERLAQLAGEVAREMGLYFPPARFDDLKRGIAAAGRDFGFKDADACIEWLVSSPLTAARTQVLARHLTVAETYFFREKKSLDVFKKDILPGIRARHGASRCVRIWSAGCASGEEPYGIAISIMESMPDLADWAVSILGTDINPRALEKARLGVYRKWSFRQCPPETQEKYFKQTSEGSFEIAAEVKKMVTFAYHNLSKDIYPSVWNDTEAMDVIFCRNVLMYFAPDAAKRVVENLSKCLVSDGHLIVNPGESVPSSVEGLAPAFPGNSIYKKRRAGEAAFLPYSGPLVTISPIQPERSLASADMEIPAGELTAQTIDANMGAAVPLAEPEGAEATMKLSRVCADRGQLAEAVRWARKGIAEDKLNPANHYLLATILQEQGELDEAASSLERAIYLDTNFVLAHFAVGNLYLRLGKPQRSATHFKTVLSLLRKYKPEDLLPYSEGMTARQLSEALHSYVEDNV